MSTIKLLAPILPFITEDIYQNLARNSSSDALESIHLCDYPEADQSRIDDTLMRQVDSLRKIVELGRSARNQASLKIRQPLAKLVYVVKDDSVADFVEKYKSVILEELNVKGIERLSDSESLLSYSIKPNLPVLGPKYGKILGKIQNQLRESDESALIDSINKNGQIQLNIDSVPVILESGDLLIDKASADGFSSTGEADMTIGITTGLTPELIQEGIVRDVIRQVQIMRKKAKFVVEDRINIYGSFDGAVNDAIMANKEYFLNETLTQNIIPEDKSGEYRDSFTVRDFNFTIAIERVKKDS